MSRERGSWFRFYDGALNNAKVQRLPPRVFCAWVNLMCLANRKGGTFTEEAAGFALRLRPDRARVMIDTLLRAGLLERGQFADSLQPHEWHLHQYRSDHSAPRMAKHRQEKQRVASKTAVTRDGPSDGSVTPPDSDTDSDTDSDKKKTPASQALAAPSAVTSGGLVDLKREVFTRGLQFLKTYGLGDNHARKILGRWRRDHGDAALINVLARAEANSVSEVVAYVEKSLRKGFSHDSGLDYHPGGIFAGLAEKFREVEDSHRR